MRKRQDDVLRKWAKRGWNGAERGSASVEFLALAVLVLLPLTYLIMAMARVQAGSFAAVTSAREAARTYVAATDEGSAASRARAAVDLVAADFGVEGADVRIVCHTTPCLQPDAAVEVHTRVRVSLPLFPDFLDGVVPTAVMVEGSALDTVDRFREVG